MGQPGNDPNEWKKELEHPKVSRIDAVLSLWKVSPLIFSFRQLARFTFTPTDTSSDALRFQAFSPEPSATTPFFSATINPVRYTPSFPFSSAWLDYLGMSTHILQPPLPEGKPADLVVGTDNWSRSHPVLKSGKAKLVWFDMKQPEEDPKKVTGTGSGAGDALLAKKGHENWWPGMRRWHIGLYCPDATLELGEPEVLQD